VSRICLYFIKPPEKDRWIKGDKYIRSFIRALLRGKPRPSGVEKVFINLCKGLDKLEVQYEVNISFNHLQPDDKVAILGTGKNCLDGYRQPNKIVAGIGLMTHPSEWPALCEQYPVVKYLQHSEWAVNVYKPYFGNEICDIWPVGIDTEHWKPNATSKNLDVLIYNKIRWDKEKLNIELREPIIKYLKKNGLNFKEVVYGNYSEEGYKTLLTQAKSMFFLCEHESQGIACCEALSMDVPVLAWDNGFCLDPHRFDWGDGVIPATSVPIFDVSCGERFKSIDLFEATADLFFENLKKKKYSPRKFILQTITLEKSAETFLNFFNTTNP
jgi:glycosyltransferase involved in cell wall biosynthesis